MTVFPRNASLRSLDPYVGRGPPLDDGEEQIDVNFSRATPKGAINATYALINNLTGVNPFMLTPFAFPVS